MTEKDLSHGAVAWRYREQHGSWVYCNGPVKPSWPWKRPECEPLYPAPQPARVVDCEEDHPNNRYLFKRLCEKHGIELGVDSVAEALRKLSTPPAAPTLCGMPVVVDESMPSDQVKFVQSVPTPSRQFDATAKCSPTLTQCPRCKNPHHACDHGDPSPQADHSADGGKMVSDHSEQALNMVEQQAGVVTELEDVKRWFMNPETGMLVQTERGPWVRYVDVLAAFEAKKAGGV